jgi:hypothetical protein
MALVGHSFSQGKQNQHSSYFIYAFPVSGFLANTSSGQTSMQALHFSKHLDSSTMTGTSTRWVIKAINLTPFPTHLLAGWVQQINWWNANI